MAKFDKIYKEGYIYIILNLKNNKFYIGSTENVHKRRLRHFRDLRKGRHHSILLQRAYDKYGESNFKFLIIETTPNYKYREDYILKNIIDLKDSYNISVGYRGGDLISNHPNKDEIIREARKNLLNAPSPPPKHGEDNPNWKGGMSIKYCKLCSKKIGPSSVMCHKCYIKQRDHSGSNNPFFGKKHSEEVLKFLKSRDVNYFPPNCVSISVNNIIYNSYKEAERALNIKACTIRHRCESKNEKFKNYIKL